MKATKTLIKTAISIGLLAALIHFVGWQEIWEALLEVNIPILLFSWFIAVIGRFVESEQMSRILKEAGAPASSWRIFLANSLSAFYGMIIPGDLLASVAKWANLSAKTGNSAAVLNAIVYNRLMLLLPWLPAGLIAFALYNPTPSNTLPWILGLVSAAIIFVTILFYHPNSGRKIRSLTLVLGEKTLPQLLLSKLRKALSSLEVFQTFRPSFHFLIMLRSIVIIGIALIKFVLTAMAVGITIPLTVSVWALCAIKILGQLPISIGGLGVREGLLISTLQHLDVSEAKAFLLGLMMFAGTLIFVVIGAVYQLCLTFGLAKWSNKE